MCIRDRHITHALWNQLGNKEVIIDVEWPEAEENLLEKKSIEIAIQINGRLRGQITVDSNLTQIEIQKIAKEQENIRKYIEGKDTKKIIYVDKKLLNFVI